MLRTAIIGLGNAAERLHIPACRALNEIVIVGACEPREQRRADIQRRFNIPRVYATPEELIEREQPELVLIGTPPDLHRDHCLLALRAGADVLCEKPFVPTVADADTVIAEAKRLGRAITLNTQYRHMRIYRETQQRLAEGEFGRLFFVQCWQQMFHPPAFEKLEWRRTLRQSTLFEFAPHALDLICFFFNALPSAIQAHTPQARPEYDSDVLVQATLRFPEERLATLALNRVSHAPERYLEMRLDCERASLRLSLGGVARASLEVVRNTGRSRPSARLSFVRGGEARIERSSRSKLLTNESQAAFASATAANLRAFLTDRARTDGSRYQSIEHAREVLRTALAGYESAQSGQTVQLS